MEPRRITKLALAVGLVLVLFAGGCAKPTATETISSTSGPPTTTPPGGAAQTAATTTARPASTAPASSATTAARPSTPAAGPYGDLTVAVPSFATAIFDPVKAMQTNTTTMMTPILDYLIRTQGSTPDNTGVAERWDISADGLSWTLYLRKGIKFHDGSALTARDVKFSLEQYMAPDAQYTFMRDMVGSIAMVDDYTLRVSTRGPQPYFLQVSSMSPGHQGLVMPADYIAKQGMANFRARPVGSGPWKFVSYSFGDFVKYEAVDNHWRKTPAFKNLTLLQIPEQTTRIAMLKTAAADVIDLSVDQVAKLEEAGFRTVTMGGQMIMLFFHGTYDSRAAAMPAADIRVRRALSLAIDRKEIGNFLFSGKMQPPMPSYMWEDQPDIDGAYWKNYSANLYRYDPAEAVRLLSEAGYPKGFSIKMYSYAQGAGAFLPLTTEALAGYWAKIGVKAELVPTDVATMRVLRTGYTDRRPAAELVGQASVFGADGGPSTPQSLTSSFSTTGAFNLLTGAIPQMDAQILSAFSEMNPAKRRDILANVIKLATDSLVAPSIGSLPTLAALGPRVDLTLPPGKPVQIAVYLDLAKHRT